VGLGDFQNNIDQLMANNKINVITNTAHAHNIYLQVLATRGIIGLAILLSLFYLLLKLGVKLIRRDEIFGGYILIITIVLTMVAGLTDNQIEFTMFLSAFCLIVGLLCPIRTSLCKEIA
jgi:O-antigen ligase